MTRSAACPMWATRSTWRPSAREVAESQNAFSLYEEAQRSYARNDRTRRREILEKWGKWDEPALEPADWSVVTPGARAWLDSNKEELNLWRRATERSAFQSHRLRAIRLDAPLIVESSFHTFARLALLDAARREAEGDMSGRSIFIALSFAAAGTSGRKMGECSARSACGCTVRRVKG